MIEFESRQIIEGFRSGVSSKAASQYFSFARPRFLAGAEAALERTAQTGQTGGMIVSGKYGEGKTHFLNTVHHMAHERNMVVSRISLSKETPFDKLHLVYQKLINHTYLPGRLQPGFAQVLENMTAGSPLAQDLAAFAEAELESNKLGLLLKSYLRTEDEDEKFMLLSDFEGDFCTNAVLKQIYKRIFSLKTTPSVAFTKTKHCMDYFAFFSHLFLQMGYSGWVLLFDETELVGRLGKKARMGAYANLAQFLRPGDCGKCKAVYSVFALTASFAEDVIESKHEFEHLQAMPLPPETAERAEWALTQIVSTEQLSPLSKEEIRKVLGKVIEFHGRAYGWLPTTDVDTLCRITEKRGHLLRTRMRASIEYLDQLYQYGSAEEVTVGALGMSTYEEDPPSLEGLLGNRTESD